MLSDSKVREAGFIRNSSSRKIIFKPQPSPSPQNHSSDDSFSSFQYDSTGKPSIQNSEKYTSQKIYSKIQKQSQKKHLQNYESSSRQAAKPVPPNVPKPSYKAMQQPTFQNQRLKNNFFQDPQKKPLQNQAPQISRTSTPYFMESSMKQELEEVNNICNRIGNMKLEENFSFNPRLNNRMLKNKGSLDLESNQERQELKEGKNRSSLVQGIKVGQKIPKRQKNNYFSNANNSSSRFQYDFESSEGSVDEDEQNERNSQESDQNEESEEERDNQILRYYQEQQRQRTEPQASMMKTKPKLNSHNSIGKITNTHNLYGQGQQKSHDQKANNHPRRVQNEESSQDQEELIAECNKDDFGTKIPVYMKNQQLAEKKGYQNRMEPQEGVIATNGGMCFNVDVKQFSQNSSVVDTRPMRRPNANQKKKKTNDREEILRRREMAKVYSKQARFRLFGFA